MMRLPKFNYRVAKKVSDAVNMIADSGPDAMFVAGGTDLYPNMKRRQQTPKTVISVTRLRELHNLEGDATKGMIIGGSITLTVTPQPSEVWIAITDTGLGMAKESLARVFDEFYQVEDHMTRQHGGLGIGLSIARALVEAHGGRIWADSPGLGKGATFTISLPLMKGA